MCRSTRMTDAEDHGIRGGPLDDLGDLVDERLRRAAQDSIGEGPVQGEVGGRQPALRGKRAVAQVVVKDGFHDRTERAGGELVGVRYPCLAHHHDMAVHVSGMAFRARGTGERSVGLRRVRDLRGGPDRVSDPSVGSQCGSSYPCLGPGANQQGRGGLVPQRGADGMAIDHPRAPRAAQLCDAIRHGLAALAQIDVEGREVGRLVPGADPEHQSAAGGMLKQAGLLREPGDGMQGEDEHAGPDLDAVGSGQQPRHRHHRIAQRRARTTVMLGHQADVEAGPSCGGDLIDEFGEELPGTHPAAGHGQRQAEVDRCGLRPRVRHAPCRCPRPLISSVHLMSILEEQYRFLKRETRGADVAFRSPPGRRCHRQREAIALRPAQRSARRDAPARTARICARGGHAGQRDRGSGR